MAIELTGPCGNIVVEGKEVEKRLAKDYTFASEKFEADYRTWKEEQAQAEGNGEADVTPDAPEGDSGSESDDSGADMHVDVDVEGDV